MCIRDRIEQFYRILTSAHEECSRHDMIVVLGDFSAKIGKEDFTCDFAGMYSLHNETSKNERILGQFAASCNMIIKSTCFKHKKIHLGTWKMP